MRLLAAMQSTVLRLEPTLARGRLVASMGAANRGNDPGAELTGLGAEIALRQGLEQTEQITRELLGSA